jgi:predicted dehydrogenase
MADGAWGHWTDMRIRRELAGVSADIIPQGIEPGSGSHNSDVEDELSACFYTVLAHAFAAGRPPAITAQKARSVMAVLEAARQSNATGQTVAPSPSR